MRKERKFMRRNIVGDGLAFTVSWGTLPGAGSTHRSMRLMPDCLALCRPMLDRRASARLAGRVRGFLLRRRTFLRPLLFLAVGLLLVGCDRQDPESARGRNRGDVVAPPAIPASLQSELESWLAQHGRPPADYVLGLFVNHDVVLLGEQHRIRHDAELVQALVPRLREAKVGTLAIEFARREEQALIDSIVNAPEWQEELAREVFFRGFMPWGFREYVDVLKAAWRANLERPPGTPALKVMGVNNSPDYSHFKTEADWDASDARRRVWGGQTEADWAEPVLAEVGRGGKVLAYCGIHHAFTGYRQPVVRDGAFQKLGDVRFGNHIRQALGQRAVTVYLHAPWSSPSGYTSEFVHPAAGRLDAFMLARQGGPFAVGFDVIGSPLADLPIEDAVYKHGHEPFTLAAFCDGWIYTKPVSQFEPVTYIDDWINADNVARARATAMNPQWRNYSVEQLTDGCRSYLDDFRRFYGHLR